MTKQNKHKIQKVIQFLQINRPKYFNFQQLPKIASLIQRQQSKISTAQDINQRNKKIYCLKEISHKNQTKSTCQQYTQVFISLQSKKLCYFSILAPVSFIIYTEAKSFINIKKNEENLTTQFQENSQNSKVKENHFKVHYGKWAMFIISIIVFDLLSSLFPKSLTIIALGLIIKAVIIKSPQKLNFTVQEIIQKLHLEVYSEILTTKFIDFYLDFSEKINFYIIFYRFEEKEEKISMLNKIKDSVSRIQLQLQDDQQTKNKSFIVVNKKIQNTSKKIKSYENVGVSCDILKGTQIRQELLKILQEKTLPKEKTKGSSISKIQEPTKDKLDDKKKSTKSDVYTPRSESLQQKMKKIKQGFNLPTSEKKIFPNQQEDLQSHLMIKRSQTFDIEQFQFQESPISKKRENNHASYGPTRTLKNTAKKVEYSESNTINSQNMGKMDIVTSQKSQGKNNNIKLSRGSIQQIVKLKQIQGEDNEIQPTGSQILPPGTNISSIDQNTIHPFKINLSSLTNPLVMSGQNNKSKVLPSSLFSSQQNLLISSGKNNLVSSSSIQLFKKEQLPNVSEVHTQIMMEQFSQQSTIPNKVQVSLNESQYSDMFESQGEEEEPNLEIKVEAVLQNSTSSKTLKPRLDICNIELYDNKDLKFYSVYDHLIFSGKILRMYKKPDNFYEIICEENRKIEDGKQVQKNEQKIQLIKKVKFRGQAKPFMKYLSQNSQ